MNVFSRWSIVSLLAIATAAHAQTTDTTPRLTGIAHVAIRVRDIAQSRAFYKKLGFTEPFNITDKDGNVTEQFIKINDRQYIELYPSDATHPAGFLHVCWEAVNLEGLYPILTAHGVVSPPVRKAGAGNMLMAWKGPEDQTVEITEYMPGSRHSNDFGKDLGSDRISDTLLAATVQVPDVTVMANYFHDKMGFQLWNPHPGFAFAKPAASRDNYILLNPVIQETPQLTMLFHVTSVLKTRKALNARNLESAGSKNDVSVIDPDGNAVQFTDRTPLPSTLREK